MKKTKLSKQDIKKEIALAKIKANAAFKTAKFKLLKAEKDIQRYIEKNPKKASAIALGTGAAIAAAITAALVKKRK